MSKNSFSGDNHWLGGLLSNAMKQVVGDGVKHPIRIAREVAVSPDAAMYAIETIQEYPDFVPACQKVEQEIQNGETVAVMQMGKGGMTVTFKTINRRTDHYDASRDVHIKRLTITTCPDSMIQLGKDSGWTVESIPNDPHACKVSFDATFEVPNTLWAMVRPFIHTMYETMISRFVERAKNYEQGKTWKQ